jgi:hypothetical protein
MSTLATEVREPRAQRVVVTDDSLVIDLLDGRTISAPLAWYPRLLHGSPEERNRWRLIGDGEGIHWPDLDEDLSVENILQGRASGESQTSFKRWLETRKRRKPTRRSLETQAVNKPFKPLKLRGKPLSQTIIEDRR